MASFIDERIAELDSGIRRTQEALKYCRHTKQQARLKAQLEDLIDLRYSYQMARHLTF